MSLHKDLIGQARSLATLDKGKPKQANLRRAVSSAYYAVFHLLVAEGAATIGSRLDAAGRAKVSRAFGHADMKEVCRAYAKAVSDVGFKPEIAPLLTFPVEDGIREVSQVFVELQEARHSADYDVASKWTRLDVLALITSVEDAFIKWKSVKAVPNAKIFLFDLLLRRSWGRA